MSSIVATGLAYAHPGGDLLFGDVSFKVAPGDHAALVGANGVGKSTLLRCLAGDLPLDEGEVALGARHVLMRQDVGLDGDVRTVRELLLDLAPGGLRAAGSAMLEAERDLDAGADPAEAGMRLGEAIADWSELGGYELEGHWDAAAGRSSARASTRSATAPRHRAVRRRAQAAGPRARLHAPTPTSCCSTSPTTSSTCRPSAGWSGASPRRPRPSCSSATTASCWPTRRERRSRSRAPAPGSTAGPTRPIPRPATHRQELLGDALQRWKDEERRLFRYFKLLKQRARYAPGFAKKANAAESRWERFVAAGPPPPPVVDQHIRVRLRGADSARRVSTCGRSPCPGSCGPSPTRSASASASGSSGPTARGKTHLVRLLAGDPVDHEGEVVVGPRVSPGHFTQLNARADLAGQVVLDVLVARVGAVQARHGALARYGLADAARRRVETLSGGQKARLEILCLEVEGHNLLLLDEPTDNLDLDSADALEQALDGFEGTVIAVSHDRHFLRGLDRFWLLDREGDVTVLPDARAALEAVATDGRVAAPRSAGSRPELRR